MRLRFSLGMRPQKGQTEEAGAVRATRLSSTLRRVNLSLTGCSSAEPVSVSVQQAQNSNITTIFTTCQKRHPFTLGIASFAAIYAILLFIDRQKSAKSSISNISNLFVLLAMILIPAGFLFKMMHWHGAGVIIYISNLALLLLIPIKYLQAAKEKDGVKSTNFYNEAFIITLVLGFSLFLLFT